MSKKVDEAVGLEAMLGVGVEFEAKGKTYTMSPIVAAHVEIFRKDNLFVGENQFFNFYDVKATKAMDKWLGGEEVVAKILNKDIKARYLFDENNKHMSLEKTMADGWDVTDYKRYFKKLCDLSG